MKQAESRINVIKDLASRTEADNRLAEVLALCEIARQLTRLGDLYLTDLNLNGDGDEIPDISRAEARKAARAFLRSAYDANDVRSK